MSINQIEGAVFDLDGVVTRTATLHARAWKESFDSFLTSWSKKNNTDQKPFALEADYLNYVDGKPREDGIQDFLSSRNISPSPEEIQAIGEEKNILYLKLLDSMGVEVFESTIRLIKSLRSKGIRTAIASSSRNCALILSAAGITNLFDARVDGNDLDAANLPGKPAPHLFIEAARRIRVNPEKSAVFEDATSGVEAGIQAKYALVVGVARKDNAQDLLEAGAHRVVTDLDEISLRDLTVS